MTEIDPSKPPPPSVRGTPGLAPSGMPHISHTTQGTSGSWHGKGSWENYKRWLGEKNYKQFMKILSQQVAREIKKDQEKAKKAAKRLKQASTGQDIDYGV